jgi:HEAT repeat protein
VDQLDQLIRQLKHGSPPEQISAAEALGKKGGEKALEPLVEALRLFRRMPVETPFTPPTVVPFEYAQLRRAAARALGDIGNASAITPLVEAVRDETDQEVVCAAVEALGKLPCSLIVVEPLVNRLRYLKRGARLAEESLLEQVDTANREFVLRAIERIKGDSVHHYETTAKEVARVGLPALDQLTKALANRDADMREVAAEMLGRIGGPEALNSLRKRLRPLIGERNKRVRACIRSAINGIKTTRG